MDMVTRAQWGARHAAGFGPAPTADEVWLHHSVTIAPDLVPPFDDEHDAMRTLERIGQDRFGKGISYTFAVMPNGRVYEGTGAGRVGAHTGGRNTRARGIVLVGNYDRDPVPDAMARAVADLLRYGQGRAGYWHQARLDGGHLQAPGASTACPGRHGMAAIPRINHLATAATSEEDDMPSPEELLNAPVPRYDAAGARAGETSLAQAAGHLDANLGRILDALSGLPSFITDVRGDLAVKGQQLASAIDAGDAGQVAAQIPDDLAQQVVDALADRLNGA